DCTVDASDAARLVTYVVTVDDDSTPIEITYPRVPPSESGRPRTITAVGPVVTIFGTDCGPGIATEPWPFTASGDVENRLSCAVFFGGGLLTVKRAYSEGAETGLGGDG